MAQADDIREFVARRYIDPARKCGELEVTVRAGDVQHAMKDTIELPAICSAIGTNKFLREHGLRLIGRRGPANGANVYFTYDISAGG